MPLSRETEKRIKRLRKLTEPEPSHTDSNIAFFVAIGFTLVAIYAMFAADTALHGYRDSFPIFVAAAIIWLIAAIARWIGY